MTFRALSVYKSAILVHCLVSFLSVRPADQGGRQLGSAAGLIAKKMRLALTVVMESLTTHCSSELHVFDQIIFIVGLSVPGLRNILHS